MMRNTNATCEDMSKRLKGIISYTDKYLAALKSFCKIKQDRIFIRKLAKKVKEKTPKQQAG